MTAEEVLREIHLHLTGVDAARQPEPSETAEPSTSASAIGSEAFNIYIEWNNYGIRCTGDATLEEMDAKIGEAYSALKEGFDSKTDGKIQMPPNEGIDPADVLKEFRSAQSLAKIMIGSANKYGADADKTIEQFRRQRDASKREALLWALKQIVPDGNPEVAREKVQAEIDRCQ